MAHIESQTVSYEQVKQIPYDQVPQTPYDQMQQTPYGQAQQTPYGQAQQTPYVTMQPTSYVTIQQPGYQANPFLNMHNEWQATLCSCCDDSSQCCYAYWCWCCFVGSLAQSVGESQLSCLFVPYALAMYRMKLRSVFQIRGDVCSDHCTVAWCPFCAGLQMRNELKFHGLP